MFLPDEQSELHTPEKGNATFSLVIGQVKVGVLHLKDGQWFFSYSEEFKSQHTFVPLPDFPDKDKIYSSTELWPFFITRIPGLNQPAIQKELIEHKIDKGNLVELLKLFGDRSAVSPYRLIWS